MSSQPLVSIITVTFNSAATVARTIAAVLQQTYPNIEYLIIDGASTDATVELCEKALSGGRIPYRIISEPDKGIYYAMNKGLALAQGAVTGIINSDDWYEKNAVEVVVDQFVKHGDGVYYGFQRKIIDNKEFMIERLNHEFLNRTMIQHSAAFITNSVYKQFGFFNTAYKFVADYELMLRFKEERVAFYMIDAVLSNFTVGGASAGYKAAIESLQLKHRKGLISRQSYLLKKARILLTDKYLKF